MCHVFCAAGVSADIMLVAGDRKLFRSVGGPGYQLIDVSDNETISGLQWRPSGRTFAGLNQAPMEHDNKRVDQVPTEQPLSSSLTKLTSATGSVKISSSITTVSKPRLRLETAPASGIGNASSIATTEAIYTKSQLPVTTETSNSVLANTLLITDSAVHSGSRKLSSLLTISGENRLRDGSLDGNASAVTVSGSREQHHNQSASTTTWSPEVNITTDGRVESHTDAWNQSDATRSTAVRVRYFHTVLTERDGEGRERAHLSASKVASIAAVCAFSIFVIVAVVVIVARRRRRTCGQTKVASSDGRTAGTGDDKLKALRRVAAESDTLSPDLLDQIIRAELARGRAKRYRARLRNGDDREQLQRLAVELTDDWGTPPPSYRRLTPVTGPSSHRRPLWAGDSPARVHDLSDLPPPVPERKSTAAVPLDFRHFRRPLPEIPRNESAGGYELVPRVISPQLSNATPVRGDALRLASSPCVIRDVIRSPFPFAASAQDGGTGSGNNRRERRRDVITRSCDIVRDVIKSPVSVSEHAQDGGTGTGSSEQRRRFPKMGRSCLLESRRQRGDSLDHSSPCPPLPPRFRASHSVDDATKPPTSGCACAADPHHPAMTSWTRDLTHIPILLRDTTV